MQIPNKVEFNNKVARVIPPLLEGNDSKRAKRILELIRARHIEHDKHPSNEVRDAIKYCVDHGIRAFDAAYAFGVSVGSVYNYLGKSRAA